jgi:hypothetical protein
MIGGNNSSILKRRKRQFQKAPGSIKELEEPLLDSRQFRNQLLPNFFTNWSILHLLVLPEAGRWEGEIDDVGRGKKGF